MEPSSQDNSPPDPYGQLSRLLAECAGATDLLEMVANHMRLLDHDQRVAVGKAAPGLMDVLLQVEHRG